jgi:hypothetical protein
LNTTAPTLRHQAAIPLWLKAAYSVFLIAMIVVYWPSYGPANFLYFCDVAAIVTALALWFESPLLAGSQAVAMTVSQTLWIIDFLAGGRLLGVSAYMFDPGIRLYVRALSTFHIWLPFLLLWMVWKLGYDRRSFWLQTFLCAAVLIASFVLTDPRQPRRGYPYESVNVNRVYGPQALSVEHWMPPSAYLALQIVLYPLCIYWPTHLLFKRIFRALRPLDIAVPALSSSNGPAGLPEQPS